MADATKIGVADATKMGVANARVANATQSPRYFQPIAKIFFLVVGSEQQSRSRCWTMLTLLSPSPATRHQYFHTNKHAEQFKENLQT